MSQQFHPNLRYVFIKFRRIAYQHGCDNTISYLLRTHVIVSGLNRTNFWARVTSTFASPFVYPRRGSVLSEISRDRIIPGRGLRGNKECLERYVFFPSVDLRLDVSGYHDACFYSHSVGAAFFRSPACQSTENSGTKLLMPKYWRAPNHLILKKILAD